MERSSSEAHLNSISSPLSSLTESYTRRHGLQLPPAMRFLQSPVASLLEYSGLLLRLRPDHSEAQTENSSRNVTGISPDSPIPNNGFSMTTRNGNGGGNGEVSIRIVDGERVGFEEVEDDDDDESVTLGLGSMDDGGDQERGLDTSSSVVTGGDGLAGDDNNSGNNRGESSYQRYDIQQLARWAEQILPFSLLLMVVFIRQHLQGFFVTIWITAFMFKSNDILKKQTALKGDRKIIVLVGYFIVFIFHVFGIYWWYRKDVLYLSLFMLPPKSIPPFWHAAFIILVNDTMVRQAAMSMKILILIYYRNGKGHNFRRQGQLLTLIEYSLLLYRALLPAPVWYKFFLNKEYGSLFSSLTTGLYLTFKLTSIVEKVRFLMSAFKALSKKEIHYGSYATAEQVNAAGDLCAICQEKTHTPILLRCKHIFCEDCVSEWFERERTCPLCRALVRPADLRSYADGSTSLFVQMC